MFGHSHQKFDQVVNGVRFVNPGYAGKPKFGAERSVAVLEIAGKNLELRFVKLTD
jgi:predicted phosphodiesterase